MTAKQPTKKTSQDDWHPAEVGAQLRMKGISLRQLSLLNGYRNPNSLAKALHKPYPTAEAIIAETLGISAQEIWPSRYDSDGRPNRGKPGQPALIPAGLKPSRLRAARNPQTAVSP